MIAAIGSNGELGLNNKLLWHISEDLKNFKKLTVGRHILMGRKTYESIGKPLPKRTTIILTKRESGDYPEGVLSAGSIVDGIHLAKQRGETELMIVGGGDIYKQCIGLAQTLYLTEVDYSGEADTFFPSIDFQQWELEEVQEYASTETAPSWKFSILKKRRS